MGRYKPENHKRYLEKRRREVAQGLRAIEHGAIGYRYDKCRCGICVSANSKLHARYRRERIAKQKAGLAEPKHGTPYGYSDGCRCDPCKTAYRASQIKQNYGPNVPPPPERCEICEQKKKLSVDHNHVTGEFRGWLCTNCNTAIGKLGDNSSGVLVALKYLIGTGDTISLDSIAAHNT